MKSVEPSGNEHRRPELSKEHAADPYATLQNSSLGQNVIDVLFGFARRAARVAQNDVRMEEMMTAIGLTRARIRLEKGVHLKFHYSLAVACSRLGRVNKEACGNFVNNDPPHAAFCQADNQLGMN